MENPRPEKVAVVEEVRQKLEGADAVLLTDYRGLTVTELGALRGAMRPAGGEFKVYKNTLVRLAARELGIDIDDVLVGPTAMAFVSAKADGSPGDIASVAKAVQDFAKTQPLLVLKGGVLGDQVLDQAGAKALASLPTASEVYARLAGAINSGARGLASATNAIARSLALVINAAAEAGAFSGAPAPEVVSPEPASTEAPEPEAADESTTAESTTDDAPEAESTAPEPENTEADAPEADAAEESEN